MLKSPSEALPLGTEAGRTLFRLCRKGRAGCWADVGSDSTTHVRLDLKGRLLDRGPLLPGLRAGSATSGTGGGRG